MKFKVGEKYKYIQNCLNEELDTVLTILKEPDNRNLILVKSEWYVKNESTKIRKEEDCLLGADYLEDRINRGYVIKIKGVKDGK